MTIEAQYFPIADYGNGATTAFVIYWPFRDPSDVEVGVLDRLTGLPVATPVLGGGGTYDYTITGTIDPDTGFYYGGGDVVFNTPPTSDMIVVRARSTLNEQDKVLPTNGRFPAKSVEGALDRRTLVSQEGGVSLSRAVVIPLFDSPNHLPVTIPATTLRANGGAGSIATYDSVGDPGLLDSTPAQVDFAVQAALTDKLNATTPIPTTDALMALFPAPMVLAHGLTFVTAGRDTTGDGGGGVFWYDSTDHATLDYGGNVRVDLAGRRWKASLPYGELPAEMFGVNPSRPDNSPWILNAMHAGYDFNMPVTFASNTYKVAHTITWDQSRTTIKGHGTVFDFTGLLDPVAFQQYSSQTDANVAFILNGIHTTGGFFVIGPGNNTAVCFKAVPSTIASLPWFMGAQYENIMATAFGAMFEYVAGQSFERYSNCSLVGTGLLTGWFMYLVGLTNAGENVELDHCHVVNALGFILDNSGNPNMDIKAVACSCDGVKYVLTGGPLANPGSAAATIKASFFAPHWECNQWTDYIVWCGNSVTAYDANMVGNASGTMHTPFRCDAGGTSPGIVLDNLTINSASSWDPGNICDGNGRFIIRGVGTMGNTRCSLNSNFGNRIPSNGFPTAADLTGNWNSASHGTWDNTVYPTGATASIRLDAATNSAFFATPCLPGQMASFRTQVAFLTVGAGDEIQVYFAYQDLRGSNIGFANAIAAITAGIPTWQPLSLESAIFAPAGTVTAVLALQCYPVTTGKAYFGLPQFFVG